MGCRPALGARRHLSQAEPLDCPSRSGRLARLRFSTAAKYCSGVKNSCTRRRSPHSVRRSTRGRRILPGEAGRLTGGQPCRRRSDRPEHRAWHIGGMQQFAQIDDDVEETLRGIATGSLRLNVPGQCGTCRGGRRAHAGELGHRWEHRPSRPRRHLHTFARSPVPASSTTVGLSASARDEQLATTWIATRLAKFRRPACGSCGVSARLTAAVDPPGDKRQLPGSPRCRR